MFERKVELLCRRAKGLLRQLRPAMRRRREARKHCRLVLFISLSLRIVCASAHLTAQVGATQPVDIAVRIFTVSGGLAPDLQDRDFRIPAVHGRHAVVVHRFFWRDDAPTYALLDMAHCASNRSFPTAADTAALNRMFQLGWRVSVLDHTGHQTPYFSSPARFATTQPESGRSEYAAIYSLEQNSGRHLVFAPCRSAAELPASTISAANAVLAPVFTLRSGAPVLHPAQVHPDTDLPFAPGSSSPGYFNGVRPSSLPTNFGGLTRDRIFPFFGPLDQPTLVDAVETARQISGQYFMLHVTHAPLTSTITLDVRLPGGPSAKYTVTAQSYSSGAFAPRVVLSGK